MLFAIVYGIPENTSPDVLLKVRDGIISAAAESMSISPEMVHPFFMESALKSPPKDHPVTVFCRLDTELFYDNVGPVSERQHLTNAVAMAIFHAFGELYQVSVGIGDMEYKSTENIWLTAKKQLHPL